MRNTLFISTLLIALMIIGFFLLTDYGILLATEIAILAIFAMSLGLIIGYAGIISLGHAAFFGIGAYTIALLSEKMTNSYVLLITSVLLCAVIALITGAIFVRTSHFYFLMITLAFGQMVYALFFQSSWAGASDGLPVMADLNLGFGAIFNPEQYYFVMVSAFIIVYIFLRLYVHSPAGKITKGVMENEARMRSLGYNTRLYKLLTYTIAGALAGLAGSLYAFFNLFVTPDLTYWMFSGQVLIMVIIGGVGTLLGPAIGSAVYILLQNVISFYTDRWVLILGAILVTLVLVGRGGIVNWFQSLWTYLQQRRAKKHLSSTNHEIDNTYYKEDSKRGETV